MPWKVIFTFAQDDAGWTELWYHNSGVANLGNVRALVKILWPKRVALMGRNTVLKTVRYSHTTQNNDSWIDVLEQTGTARGAGGVPLRSAYRNLGMLIRFTDADGYRRIAILRGMPAEYTITVQPFLAAFDAAFLTDVKTWIDDIVANWAMQQKDRVVEDTSRRTLEFVRTGVDRLYFKTLVPAGFVVGSNVSFRGLPKQFREASGPHRVMGFDNATTEWAVAVPNISQEDAWLGNGKAYVYAFQYNYDSPVEGALMGVSTRDTGRPFGQRRGRAPVG